jgi:hypothetical protein
VRPAIEFAAALTEQEGNPWLPADECAPFENREGCGSLSCGSAGIKNQSWASPRQHKKIKGGPAPTQTYSCGGASVGSHTITYSFIEALISGTHVTSTEVSEQ